MRSGGAGGVLERVRQSLLSHAEHGQLDTIGELVRIAVEIHRHRDSRRVHPREQLVEAAEARLGLERLRLGLLAQHAEQPAHLDQRFAAGGRDAPGRFHRALG